MSRRDKVLRVWAAFVAVVVVVWTASAADDGVGMALAGALVSGVALFAAGAVVISAIAWIARPPQS
jgi:hypothetical protein